MFLQSIILFNLLIFRREFEIQNKTEKKTEKKRWKQHVQSFLSVWNKCLLGAILLQDMHDMQENAHQSNLQLVLFFSDYLT